jgi:hypothetical protein
MSDIVYLEKTDIGATLTTWIYCAMWQMFAAEKLGLRCYINWPADPMRALRPCYDENKFKEIPNMWDWYFEQPHFKDQPVPPRERVWQWEAPPPDLAQALGQHNLYGEVKQIKEFYKKHLVFKPVVNERGEALVKKYGIDFNGAVEVGVSSPSRGNSKTIGITWRGTDSVIDGRPRMPIETYFKYIDAILADSPDMRIMCTAEEESIIDPLLKRYPQAFKIQEFFTAPLGKQTLGDNPERFNTHIPGFERGMQPALMVWLFSKCAHYIKNRSSTGAVASWLSDGRIVCLAHPENLGHGFDVTKAEIEGRIIPL